MKRPRGYSIVEVAIVMIAFITLISGLTWPFASRIRTEQSRSELAYMEEMRGSVIAYASRHRTIGNTVVLKFSTGLGGVPVTLDIPQGRPILPCPDTTGDGYENRNAAISGPATLSVQVSTSGTESNVKLRLKGGPGRCASTRGMWPHLTLRSKAADYWGQRYSYAVDPMLSNGLFGFDGLSDAASIMNLVAVNYQGQNCPASDYRATDDRSRPTAPGTPRYSAEAYSYLAVAATLDAVANLRNVPVVVGGPRYNVTTAPSATALGIDDLVIAGGFHNAVYVDIAADRREIFAAGGDELQVRRYCWTDFDALTGVGFAIISHGRNGYGAVNHQPSATPTNCLTFPAVQATTYDQWEKLNAANNLDTFSSTCTKGSNTRNFDLIASYNDAYNSPDLSFDDLVVWMTPRDIYARLREVLALPDPPPVRLISLQ